jgi:integrase
MLWADLKAAGIPYRLDPAHGKAVDFHSLRHTCGDWLAATGVPQGHPGDHARLPITLTMDRYTHVFRGDEAAAIAKLPKITVANPLVLQSLILV